MNQIVEVACYYACMRCYGANSLPFDIIFRVHLCPTVNFVVVGHSCIFSQIKLYPDNGPMMDAMSIGLSRRSMAPLFLRITECP